MDHILMDRDYTSLCDRMGVDGAEVELAALVDDTPSAEDSGVAQFRDDVLDALASTRADLEL